MSKAIIFDLGGVIFEEGHWVRNLLHPLVSKTYPEVKKAYVSYSKGEIDKEEFAELLSIKHVDRLVTQILDSLKLDKDFYSLMNYLKNKYKLCICSGLPQDWLNELEQRYEFNEIFELIVTSSVGAEKPDPELFRILLDKIKVPAQDCYLIDNLLVNLKIGHSLGMKTIWCKKEEETLDFEPDYTIKGLINLKDIF